MDSVYCAVRTEYLYLPRGTWRVFTARYGLNINIHLEEFGVFTARYGLNINIHLEEFGVFTARYGLNLFIYIDESQTCWPYRGFGG